MKANAALVRSTCIIVLDAEACENLESAVVHPHRDAKGKLAGWPAQNVPNARVEVHHFSNTVELCLGNFECIDLICHDFLLHGILSFIENISGHPGREPAHHKAYVEHEFIVRLPNKAQFHLNVIRDSNSSQYD